VGGKELFPELRWELLESPSRSRNASSAYPPSYSNWSILQRAGGGEFGCGQLSFGRDSDDGKDSSSSMIFEGAGLDELTYILPLRIS
jgi:hypothetical protein